MSGLSLNIRLNLRKWLSLFKNNFATLFPPPPPPPPPLTSVIRASPATVLLGQTSTIFITWNDVVINFTLPAFAITGGTLSNLVEVDPTHYTALFTPEANTVVNATVQVQQSGTGGAVYHNAAMDTTAASNVVDIFVNTVTPPQVFKVGVNLSGAENQFPQFTSAATVNYFASKQITLIRFPFNWSKPNSTPPFTGASGAQPTAFGALDTTSTLYGGTTGYMGAMAAVVQDAINAGSKVILDCHMFGNGPNNEPLGTSGMPTTALADLWGRIANYFVTDNPSLLAGIDGFDIMNEWVNGFDSSIVQQGNQLAVNAIRAAGFIGKIYVEGTNYTGAWNWTTGTGQPFNNNNLNTVFDPLYNLVFEPHMYPDPDNSGTNYSWASSIATSGSAPPGLNTNVNIGPERLALNYIGWATGFGLRTLLGEYGSSSDTPWQGGSFNFAEWNQTTRNLLTYLQGLNISITLWAAGAGFQPGPTGYAYSLDPFNVTLNGATDYTATGVQAPAMVVLDDFTGFSGAQPTAYVAFPPNAGPNPDLFVTNGVASGNFTIYYGGKITSPVTISLADFLNDGTTSAGGTFTPSSVTLGVGENALAFFTYTASQVSPGIQIQFTNNAGWHNPPNTVISSEVNLWAGAHNISNILALRQMYPYIGNAITLQRQQDNAQMSFAFNNAGNLPRQAIQNWANSRVIPVVTWYDQGPLQGNAILYGTAPFLTLVNSAGYPEITATSGVAQMGFASQSNLKGLQTILSRLNSLGGVNSYISQDIFLDMFRMTTLTYNVGPDNGTVYDVATGAGAGSWQNIAGSYSNLYTTNNLNGYLNGTLNASVSAASFTWSPLDTSGFTSLFWFRFGGDNWQGSSQNVIITYDELTAAEINAFYASDNTYYTTSLPDSLSAAAPTIVGGAIPNNAIFAGVNGQPLLGVTILDTNPGSPTDTLTITLSGASATLSGSGITGSNPYSVASNTPANLTTIVQNLIMNTSASAGAVIDIAISATSSAGPNASTSMVVTLQNYIAETPFAAPSGTFTPVNKYGVNLSGGENVGFGDNGMPYQFQYDYFSGKGFGLIRMPITSQSLYTTALGLLDTGYVNAMYTSIVSAFDDNMYVVIDPHDFGNIWNSAINNFEAIIPGTSSQILFNDMWTRIMTKFKNCPNVIFGIQNEPVAQSLSQWWTIIASVVTTARNNSGATQLMTVPGGATFTAAGTWVSSGNAAAALTWATGTGDPANNFVFEMHQYLDAFNEGNTPVAVTGLGGVVLEPATAWLAAHGYQAVLFEFGLGWDPWYPISPGSDENYDPTRANTQVTGSVTENTAMLAYMQANSAQWAGWSAWAGGIEFPTPPQASGYYFNPEPVRNGGFNNGYTTPIVDQPQIAVLQQFLTAPTRNVFQQPFGTNSIWNTPLGRGGGGLVSGGTGPHGGAVMEYSDATGPVYEFAGVTTSATSIVCDENLILMGPASPLQVVHTNTFGWSGNPAAPGRCAATQTATATTVPIPTNASYPGLDGDLVTNACTQPAVYGGEPNCAAAILLADRATLYQQQPMQICSTGGVPTTEFFFSNVSITSDETSSPPSAYGSHGGSAMSALGGTIRMNELIPGNCPILPGVADVMRHALSCAFESGLFTAFTSTFVWPATNSDGGSEGLLLALLPTFNINSLHTAPGKSMAWTIMNYGMYINDTNPAGPFGDGFNINPEYSYGDTSVNCPTGRVMCQFSTDWSMFMSPSPNTANTWGEDLITICQNLYVVTNNGPTAIGGGAGSLGRLQLSAAPASDQGVVGTAPTVSALSISVSIDAISSGLLLGQVQATHTPYLWTLTGTGSTNFWIQPTTGKLYVSATGATGITTGTYNLTASATNIAGTNTGAVTVVVH